MRPSLKSELPILFVVLLPFLYLAYIWNSLPAQVPIHWNAEGEIDGWGDKIQLWIIPFLLPLLTYFIMYFAPSLDPKQKIQKMGSKYQHLKMLLVSVMSALALYIIYSAQSLGDATPKMIFVLMGLLFAGLGNYMQTIKQNYIVGFRTPWTLENEQVWKSTHRLGGKVWFIGGLLIAIIPLTLSSMTAIVTLFFIGVFILTAIPFIHSYRAYKKLQ